MFNLIPNRYAEPKWQAYITPDKNAFVFSSGRKVRSIYDLKMALTEESEDIIASLISDGKNQIADWVGNVLGDKELAEDMRRYDHRWGLIVSLERHMMRTLSLPSYVAKRWLSETSISFTFVSGQQVNSLESLIRVLKEVDDATVSFHRERSPNDISKWMMDIIGDYQLAELLEEAQNRLQMIHFAEDHLEMIKEAALSE